MILAIALLATIAVFAGPTLIMMGVHLVFGSGYQALEEADQFEEVEVLFDEEV